MTSSLVDRINERYLDEGDEVDDDIMITSFISASPGKLGTDGYALQLIVLNHLNIDRIGDVANFANLVKRVSEVDLAWNKISKWKDVGTMLKHLPNLRIFNLSHNHLEAKLDENDIPTCHLLDTLILNGTNLPLASLGKFLGKMPSLHEFHFSENSFDDKYLDAMSAGPSGEGKENGTISTSVSLIHLNRCGISRWSDAARMLSLFPKRETVFLTENPIREIGHLHNKVEPLTTIRMVNLSKTNIDNWTSIENIEDWPRLVDLRINGIPLLEEHTDEEKLHLVVGRIDKLELLNGSTISKEQRETSERFFIRYYEEKNPRPKKYEYLLAKHGNLEKLVKVDLSPKTHAKVRVLCEEANYDKEISLRLTRTVGQLMHHLEKIVAVPYERMRLFYLEAGCSKEDGYAPTELRFPKQILRTLHIEDGAQFEVQSKIVASRKRTQTKSLSSSSSSSSS